ncbi:MAG: hypothetical protein RI947_330 [Candidatus Parcubacteria bacterium]
MKLNEEQQQAVAYSDGPLLIVAGAGTGKTSVIVEKIRYLIQEKDAKPESILALTFTEKAAFEMEERVDRMMPYGYFQMWIATFHSFSDQILRNEISQIGLNPGYKLMTQAETIIFLKERLFLFQLKYFRPLGNPYKFLESLVQHFSRLRDEDISPEQYLDWAGRMQDDNEMPEEEKAKYMELAEAYETYQQLKIKEGFFDFSDLIFYTLELFRKRPNILMRYKSMFQYTLVDEFQDTNIAQYMLIKMLCPPEIKPRLTVVGDDSQAIYKFRGASVSNILNFMKDYSDAHQITLNKNYRSNQSILDASYKLIQYNNPDTLEAQLGISKRLTGTSGVTADAVSLYVADRGEEEADYVAEQIMTLKQKKGYSFSDFALLVRANSHAEPFLGAFARNAIPYRFFGPGMLFKQPEIKDLIAYLKVLYNVEDTVSLYRVLTMEVFKLNISDITLLISFAKKTSLPLYQALLVYLSTYKEEWSQPSFEPYKKYVPMLSDDSNEKLVKIMEMITRHLALVKKETAGQILYYFLEDSDSLKMLTSFKTEKDEKRVMNISKFFERMKALESEREDATVFAAVDYIDMSMELGESPIIADTEVANYDAVNVLTVHASKGLEFPVVFLPSLSKGRFPTTEKREPIPIPQQLIKEVLPQGDYHLQEERRLFYVALTRAKERAFLTASQAYGEGKRARKISPFVTETLGEEEVAKFQSIKKESKLQLSIFDFKKPEDVTREKKQELNLTNFSFSQLESFNMCPLQYKYQYLLKIPTPPSNAASFGDSIHRSLQQFYMDYINDNSIGLPHLVMLFHKLWIPLGYTSKAHADRMKREGINMLTRYFQTFHHEHVQVHALEKLFKIKIEDNVYVTGKIDRVDDKGNGEIEIIDYKTGKKPDEKELKKSLQLSIYALAATDQGLYKKEVSQVTLTFYYLQDMSKTSMKRTAEELMTVKQQILESADMIKQNEFLAKVGPWCSFCPFRMICDAWQ